jgi:hypothetical protein
LPRLEILPAAQRHLWSELGEVPDEFTLYGGMAIALHLGHRKSVDFDFSCTKHFDPDRLLRSVAFLSLAEVIQRQDDALTVRVERDGPVLISFFATPQPGRIDRPMIAPEDGLKIASLIDFAGMKADVVQRRAEAKDDLDIDALMPRRHCPAKGSRRSPRAAGEAFNPQITLKALACFGDGNLAVLPEPLELLASAYRVALGRDLDT